MDLVALIRSIPDFPVPGILFRDITTLIKDGDAFREAVEVMAQRYKGERIDKVAAIEARGWIFGAPIAYTLGAGFVAIRKPGKLPAETIRAEYELEYGVNALELHKDAIEPGEKVLVVDDLLATGGTGKAAVDLIERLGGEVVGVAFLIELVDLNGRKLLEGYDVQSIITFEGA